MLSQEITHRLINAIDMGNAIEIEPAMFRQGEEDEIITRFYEWPEMGRLVQAVENRRTTGTEYHFLSSTAENLFKEIYL